MTKGIDKRKNLFDKFSKQLAILRSEGFVKGNFKYELSYLCPICLDEFSEQDLVEVPNKNYLTLEDAPPASLGGSKIALTCKTCNSRCGHEIDFHLTEALREIDASYFYTGSVQRGTIDYEGKRLNVEVSSEGNGTLTAYHRTKNNNPTLLERFIFSMKEKNLGPVLNFKPPKSRVNSKRVTYALLKAHYIITFSKFGYLFLMDEEYDPIREQLKNPDKDIFPYSPFIKNQFTESDIGTHYILDKGLESIFNIFMLKTDYSKTFFGGLLPMPKISFKEFADRIERKKGSDNAVKLYRTTYDPKANLFEDMSEMEKIWNWIGLAA